MDRAVILAAALVVAGGSGFADQQSFNLGGFTNIVVGDGVTLDLEVGQEFSIAADGNRAGMRQLNISQNGETLEIERDIPWSLVTLARRAEINVTVTMPSLDTLEANSGSTVHAEGQLVGLGAIEVNSGAHVRLSGIESDELEVEANSGARVALSGSCTELSLDVTSGAAVDAGRLTCATGVADAAAGGAAVVHVTDAIEAHAFAGGSVDVAGNPAIREVSHAAGGAVVLH